MTGQEFRSLRQRAGLSYRKCARWLGVAPTTVLRWEYGTRIPSDVAERIQAVMLRPGDEPETAHQIGVAVAQLEHALHGDESVSAYASQHPAHALAHLLAEFQAEQPHPSAKRAVTAILRTVPRVPRAFTPTEAANFWIGYYQTQAELAGDVQPAEVPEPSATQTPNNA